ncbi:cupredoxin family copper-binding protein [Pararhizobium sp. IMCC21322]|uniref:cupredoxin domain-containing protein n=1 Tax=Pararhizobium sp. IMCC21322 TaxID=3067903 RepID=UPI0027403D4B|nr:cupredoxin family copper-binding protein [Pararhizobium sp. IMCC21322]
MTKFFKTFLTAGAAICLAGIAQAADIKADIKGMAFSPATITVSVGDTITFTNRDGAPHTATAADGSFTTATLRKGKSETIAFDSAGTFAFFCKIHRGMKGTIVVQ